MLSTELEVSPVTASHPIVTIISPTPRLPITHKPSASPFEPDLEVSNFIPHHLSHCFPLPPPTQTHPPSHLPPSNIHLSSQHTRQAQQPALPKRRKSLSVDPVERRPRNGDADYIKHPENAFTLFKCCEERNGVEEGGQNGSTAPVQKQHQADLFRLIGQQSKMAGRGKDLAKEKKKEHEQLRLSSPEIQGIKTQG